MHKNIKQATRVIEKAQRTTFKELWELGLDCKHVCIIDARTKQKLSSKVGMTTIIKHTLIVLGEGGRGAIPIYANPPLFFSLGPRSYGSTKKLKSVLKKNSVHDRKLATEKVVYYCQRLVVVKKYLDFLIHWVLGVFFLIFFLGFGNLSAVHLTTTS
jgi:hypothetical protein